MIEVLILTSAILWCIAEAMHRLVSTGGAASIGWMLALFTLVGVLVVFWLELHLLGRFRKGLVKAREGLLEPISARGLTWTGTGRVVVEYNETINALRSMFTMVEECQSRFLTQRNNINTILQSVPGALLSLASDLQIVMTNKQAEDLFAEKEGNLVGKNLFDVMRLDEIDRGLLRDAFLYKQPISNQEISLLSNPDQRFSLNLGFYSDRETDLGGVIILQDVSEYHRLQESVAIREKLVAMGQLAAGVAHELNTPLGNISGYAQLLGQALGQQSEHAAHVQTISEEARRCSRIVHDLLNFARTDRCSGETCDVNQLVQELIETFINCRLRRYNIEVSLDLMPASVVVEGGCGQLDIVLTNLILNSIQALDGVVQPRIEIASRMDGDFAIISVSDNGPGVPKEHRKRIFDPFFTTKDVGQGSGLGLPISHAIVAKRGGYIFYDESFSSGARFVIRLPAVDLRRAGLAIPSQSIGDKRTENMS
jgi:two-component system, NtrC family, sensor kinase